MNVHIESFLEHRAKTTYFTNLILFNVKLSWKGMSGTESKGLVGHKHRSIHALKTLRMTQNFPSNIISEMCIIHIIIIISMCWLKIFYTIPSQWSLAFSFQRVSQLPGTPDMTIFHLCLHLLPSELPSKLASKALM